MRDTGNLPIFNGEIMRERTKRDSSRKFPWTVDDGRTVSNSVDVLGRSDANSSRGCSWQLRLP